MNGLFFQKETGEYTSFHLLRFYDNGYVLYKKVTGTDSKFLSRELRTFSMNGMEVNGQPEYTFCGAYNESGDSLSFKVENEILNPAETWTYKDILSFKGTLHEDHTLTVTKTSKHTGNAQEHTFTRISDQEFLQSLPSIV